MANYGESFGKGEKAWPTTIAGYDPWPSICDAVPQTYGEAVELWGEDVVACEPHEWDNRTTTENTVWLLCRLHIRLLLEKCKQWPAIDPNGCFYCGGTGPCECYSKD